MSKKGKKAAQSRKPVSTRSGKTTRPATASPRGRTHPHKESTKVNLLAVRILAGVLAALCLAGIIAVLMIVPAPYTTPTVIEVILLAFITGFSAFTAIRPEGTVRWFRRLVS